jgi:hypothetical protein
MKNDDCRLNTLEDREGNSDPVTDGRVLHHGGHGVSLWAASYPC